MAILSILFTVIIIAVSILMVLVVLIQRPKQEGLGAAFGGGALDSALGAHTTDVLQKFTSWLGILFFVSAISLAMIKTRQFRDSAASNVLEGVEAKKPEAPALPPEFSNIPGLENLSLDPGSVPATPETPSAPGPAAETPEAPEAPKSPDPAKPAAETKPAAPAPAPAAETKPADPAPVPAPAAQTPAPVESKPAEPAKPAAPAPAPAADAPKPADQPKGQ
jgi:preprotein translocase subunit SecG